MKVYIALLSLPLLAGCLTSSTPPEIKEWLITASKPEKASKHRFGVVRISQVSVRAPFDTRQMCVLRADGSVASDEFNCFAALPASLLKGAVIDDFLNEGAFAHAVGPNSSTRADFIAEVTFERLALDCQTPQVRKAVAQVSVRLLDANRELFGFSEASAAVDAADGNYSRAFSEAANEAIVKAIRLL